MTKLYDDLSIGMTAETKRLCREEDLIVFANASGNFNPLHVPMQDGDGDGATEAIAPGMWIASLISSVLGNTLPGPGTVYKSQTLEFLGQAHAGETLTIKVDVLDKGEDRSVTLGTRVESESGTCLVQGTAVVQAPLAVVPLDTSEVPGLVVNRHVHFERLLARAEPLAPLPTAVVAPEKPDALEGPLLAAERTLIAPTLIGARFKIEEAAEIANVDVSPYEIIDVRSHKAAAEHAVGLVRQGKARAIMKGHLHTEELLAPIVKHEGGLRRNRRLSHVYVMDVPGLTHLLMITDAAINIAPDLKQKADIVQNAIDLALAIGVEEPKVGILSAVETVTTAIPSTLDAAVLSKMAERGQITGGLVDGPLAMDNAIDLQAARTKGITSSVAGRANILVAPNLEAGNMLAKELTFLAHADAGGIVMGARCPIILTSRADSKEARLASCAIAALAAQAQQ
ncbi:MAG: bifunctional enoyl-CoA hydratase/phosphate acetyltransferase [Pseudomonadota bacterium]